MAEITLYTDGAALGNPGPGGFGAVLISGSHRKEIAGGFRLTTNNRMELLAVIKGLEALKNAGNRVTIYSDSKYVVDAISKKWVNNWVKTNFKGKKNEDLWRRYLNVAQMHQIELVWVKGHAGIEENERCDVLATQMAAGSELQIDHVYEQLAAKGLA